MENPTVQIRPKAQRADSFVIHVRERDRSDGGLGSEVYKGSSSAFSSSGGVNISATKILSRIRKIFMRFIFYFPSRGSSAPSVMTSRQTSSERFEPPKTSCSSHYSSYSHYNEAIADCIEFFNKSSQEQTVEGRRSDAFV